MPDVEVLTARDVPRDFQHHSAPLVDLGTATARVFLGTLVGETSPVTMFTPLLGAEIILKPQARVYLDLDPSFEHGVLVDTGPVTSAVNAMAHAVEALYSPEATPTVDTFALAAICRDAANHVGMQ